MNWYSADNAWFRGAVSLEVVDGAIKPWRIPYAERELYPPKDQVPARAERAAGVRLCFETDSPFLECALVLEQTEDPVRLDLTCEGEILRTAEIKPDAESVRYEDLSGERRRYEIWLPQFAVLRVRGISISEGAVLEAVAPENDPVWLTYGSSITHCRAAASPARTWPGVAARAHGLNLTCLGYGGSCHLDPMVGRMIRDSRADLITLKLGINVYGGGTLNLRTFQPAVIGLVKLIREKHPDVPIGLITPIFSPPREEIKNNVDMTLEDYRREVREAFARLRAHGDNQLFLFEGTDLLGPDDAHLLPDELHPNPEGYELMGHRAAEFILPVLLQALSAPKAAT